MTANDDTVEGARPAPKLDNIHFVLSHTTEPMNVGATARALKTMGLSRMVLINPRNPFGERSRVVAHGAEDVLDRARVVLDHKAAVREMIAVAGATARPRELRKGALLPPNELAQLLVEISGEGPVALMFGTERTGLTNEEIYGCRYVSRIDADPAQSSLNLAQAV
ncbi:RNA methyltransferase, partial [bacterium]|nr:RNA methyltransferase [bacterium]